MNGTIDYSTLDTENLIKLDSGSKANVQFKPSKKMKKRRQLDALVSNGKKLPRRKMSGHELLRSNDSESSEVEEFSVLESQNWSKRWTNPSCCSTCYTLTCILVVASCFMACTTLIWMHLELKRDFNDLKNRMELVFDCCNFKPRFSIARYMHMVMAAMENKNAGTPDEIQALQSKLVSVNKTVSEIKMGKNGLDALNASIISIQTQISKLMGKVSEIDDTLRSPEMKVQAVLGNTVAGLGSKFATLNNTQKQLSTELETVKSKITQMMHPDGRESGHPSFNVGSVQTHLDNFTQTLEERVRNISSKLDSLALSQQYMNAILTQKTQADHGNMTSITDDSQMVLETVRKDHQAFLLFKTEIFQDIGILNASLTSINETVGALNEDMGDLFTKMSTVMRDLSNMTSVVEGLTVLMQLQQNPVTEDSEAENHGAVIKSSASTKSSTPAVKAEEAGRPSPVTQAESNFSKQTETKGS